MRNAVLGAAGGLGVGLVMAVVGWQGVADDVYAGPSSYAAGTHHDYGKGEELITLNTSVDDRRSQLVVIDPSTRVMAVFHVAQDSGKVALKSVRNFTWDLQMRDFNAEEPLPHEIRSALDQR